MSPAGCLSFIVGQDMLSWFRRFVSPEARQIRTMRKSLAQPPEEVEVDQVYPIFTPASFYKSGKWVGSYLELPLADLGMTWAVFGSDQTMRYVDRSIELFWAAAKVDWRQRALANLRTCSESRPFTHEFRSESGGIYAVAMMHEDGNGPARLLLRDLLNSRFPDGYEVGLPEMSCGVAISRRASATERGTIEAMVQRCFTNGTRPLVDGLHDPSMIIQSDNQAAQPGATDNPDDAQRN